MFTSLPNADWLILVPLVVVPTALAGVFPHTMIGFAILDPLLALGAWWLLARETRGVAA